MRLNRGRVIPGRGCVDGVVGPTHQFCRTGRESENDVVSGSALEQRAVEGESPVRENLSSLGGVPE